MRAVDWVDYSVVHLVYHSVAWWVGKSGGSLVECWVVQLVDDWA